MLASYPMTRPRSLQSIKIALVHDYLREYGGAERVLEALHDLFPEAPVYTAFVAQQELGPRWSEWDVRTTWLAKVPGIKRWFSPLRFLAPAAFADLDLSAYDLVITSTNAYFAKAVKVKPGALQVCYCHTPARSLYGYMAMSDWRRRWFTRWAGELLNHYLRVIDWQVAQQRVSYFIANSQETARRIKKFYRRDSVVIWPPVGWKNPTPRKAAAAGPAPTFLYVNRLALSKHPELAVQAANELGVQLIVVGTGPLLPKLKEAAGPTVTFRGAVDDQELQQLYAGATALLYPVENEDFGMVPIEAMMAGTPVIAHRSGGPKETIIEGKTGVFFDELTVPALVQAITTFQRRAPTFNRKKIATQAQQYSIASFQQKLLSFLDEVVTRHQPTRR